MARSRVGTFHGDDWEGQFQQFQQSQQFQQEQVGDEVRKVLLKVLLRHSQQVIFHVELLRLIHSFRHQ